MSRARKRPQGAARVARTPHTARVRATHAESRHALDRQVLVVPRGVFHKPRLGLRAHAPRASRAAQALALALAYCHCENTAVIVRTQHDAPAAAARGAPP